MNKKLLLLGFALTATLIAADDSKILLRGAAISVEEGKASGAARTVVGDMSISAEVITFDREKNTLKCDGAVTIRAATLIDCRKT